MNNLLSTHRHDLRLIGRTLAYGFCALIVLAGLLAADGRTVALGIRTAFLPVLAFNEWGIRSRLPLLNAAGIVPRVAGWVIVAVLYLTSAIPFA